tara:strand:+ start:1000 stop:1680 length:681 start_codon:yes stop_codon:yes gene_type:complete
MYKTLKKTLINKGSNILNRSNTKTRRVRNKYCYIFGYGTLINDISRRNTLKRSSIGIPAIIKKDFLHRRKYSYGGTPGKIKNPIKVLGIEKCLKSKSQKINGILFKLPYHKLKSFDKREGGAIRTQVEWKHIIPYYKDDFPVKKRWDVFIYDDVNSKIKPSDQMTPSEAYIDTTVIGLEKFDEEMAKMFFKTTVGLPRNINTYSKWKKKRDKRLTEYVVASHYGIS